MQKTVCNTVPARAGRGLPDWLPRRSKNGAGEHNAANVRDDNIANTDYGKDRNSNSNLTNTNFFHIKDGNADTARPNAASRG